MIKFICDIDSSVDVDFIKNLEYCDLLKKECYFSIIIDNEVFYEEPLFPIYEFLYFYINWNKIEDFKYITVESDDNPMISFVKIKDGWGIDSVWKKFNCNSIFSLLELTEAVESLIVT